MGRAGKHSKLILLGSLGLQTPGERKGRKEKESEREREGGKEKYREGEMKY